MLIVQGSDVLPNYNSFSPPLSTAYYLDGGVTLAILSKGLSPA